ncbi:hypothetical protein BKA65DRAFT_87906 [Rhexocercosporidium sp. MPI-PUGE-AT-0058]|nr:hypothetical protein BKA65DRAFT_87906 [Rhexocercosporidium sp. MPI-PUGE-AT-0058]
MKSNTFSTLWRNNACVLRPVLRPQGSVIRLASTEIDLSTNPASLQTNLFIDLTSRPINKTFDFISSNPWNLLNKSLADFLPPSCRAHDFDASDREFPKKEFVVSNDPHSSLPLGHHLVYFPPPVLDSDLLPDGTDSLHSPGPPFVKRLWAGGSLVFNQRDKFQMKRFGNAVCAEDIADVSVKGNEGQEKVFVTIHRRMAFLSAQIPNSGKPAYRKNNIDLDVEMNELEEIKKYGLEDIGPWAIIETRDLVFLREKSKEEAREDFLRVAKVVKPIHTPDFSVSLTPNAALLFRFSALTFNAHRIHLDPQYTREVEGHRNLLVHGPLTLVLMLSVLRSQIPEGKIVVRFDYKNLAPLYVDEEMKICVRRDPKREDKLDVWVEGREGGYAVKGTAVIGHRER